jgi:glycosyltransferase involved in cell wall biosynthesis
MKSGEKTQDYHVSHLGPGSFSDDYDEQLFSPGTYDFGVWHEEQQLLDWLVETWVPTRGRYLDFACATGRVIAHLESRFEVSVGLDISESMLAAARQKVRSAALVCGDARRLPDVQCIQVWRKRHHEALRDLIAAAGVDNVSVINGYVEDMGALYDNTHATVLAGHDHASFKPAPHSALESLGRGKPLLVTPTSSIADIVRKGRCGIVFEPKISAFEEAVRNLMGRYQEIQGRCHPTVELCFSKEGFIERYRLLYEELLEGSEVRSAAQAPMRATAQ